MSQTNSPFAKFKKIPPKKIAIDERELVKSYPLISGHSLPLVFEPAVDDLDTLGWLESKASFLEERLYKHGAILFRGFDVKSVSDFESFAGKLCPTLFGEYGDLPHAEGKVYDVTPYPPEGTILFHNESSHLPRFPMKQFFYCKQPAREGGATPIVDCRELYRILNPELRDRLAKKKLRYVRNFIEGVDVPWREFFKTEDRAEVEDRCREQGIVFEWKNIDDLMTYQIGPAVARHPKTGEMVLFNQIQLHHISCLEADLRQALLKLFPVEDLPRNVYFGDGSVLEDEAVRGMERLYWDQSVSFEWQPGDILMLDNMLVAHARNPYTPPRKIFVAMGEITRTGE